MDAITGRVWKFGDDVDTDAITPAQYMGSMQEMKAHVLEVINPEFPRSVKPGDIIVAGDNFGCGSSRETAPGVLRAIGLGGVVAESFARIFFRNSIAIGLPIVTCPNVTAFFADGDRIKLDIIGARITNLTRGESLQAQPLPAEMREVLSRGGIVPLLKEIAQRQSA
jgi:3-isopropylmalate/(R)-2-methylmalate dehydratase small subunit